jgi:hypothetical protein
MVVEVGVDLRMVVAGVGRVVVVGRREGGGGRVVVSGFARLRRWGSWYDIPPHQLGIKSRNILHMKSIP